MIGIAEWTVNPTPWVGCGGLVELGLRRREKRECLPANRCADAPCDPRNRLANAYAALRKLVESFAQPTGALGGMR